MKKAFFAFVAVSAIVLSACNNKPAETTEVAADTTAVAAEPVAAEPVAADSATVAADSTATPAAH